MQGFPDGRLRSVRPQPPICRPNDHFILVAPCYPGVQDQGIQRRWQSARSDRAPRAFGSRRIAELARFPTCRQSTRKTIPSLHCRASGASHRSGRGETCCSHLSTSKRRAKKKAQRPKSPVADIAAGSGAPPGNFVRSASVEVAVTARKFRPVWRSLRARSRAARTRSARWYTGLRA